MIKILKVLYIPMLILLVPIAFLAIAQGHNTGICKRAMSSSVLKWYGSLVIALFRLVGSNQILKLVLPLNKHKTVDQWDSLKYWLQNSLFEHPVNLLLESFFQMHQDWSARCLLGSNTLIYMDMTWGSWKASNTLKASG